MDRSVINNSRSMSSVTTCGYASCKSKCPTQSSMCSVMSCVLRALYSTACLHCSLACASLLSLYVLFVYVVI